MINATEKVYNDFINNYESEYWEVLFMSDPDIILHTEILDFIESESKHVAYEYASEYLEQVDWVEIIDKLQKHYDDNHCGNCSNELENVSMYYGYCSSRCEKEDFDCMTNERI
jgi:hypothetical protein